MLRYITVRVLQSLLSLFIIITAVFMLLRLMPEDGYFQGEEAAKFTEAQKEAALEEMGLRDPLYEQLLRFYGDLLQGDLGESIVIRPGYPISKIIGPKIMTSLQFGLAALALSLLVGIPIGVVAATWKGKWPDLAVNGYVVFINAVPAAVYFLFIQVYATELLNIPMLYDDDELLTWLLPVVCMSLAGIASYAMWIRRYMVDELNKDYIRLARAKGVKNTTVMFKHVLRNAYVPMAQYLPTTILLQIGGSLYLEALYSIPGMGGYLVSAIQRQDNTVVQALVLIFSSIGVFGLFLGDLLMGIFDPRIKLSRKGGESR